MQYLSVVVSYKITNNKLFFINLIFISICSLIILLSVLIKPSSKGYGTHTSLGFSQCITSKIFKIKKCPSCGLTTAFALIGKGKFDKAISIHPWSPVLYGLIIFILLISIISLLTQSTLLLLITIPISIIIGLSYVVYWTIEMFKLI